MVDRGCNGGFLGKDALVLSVKENAFADIVGMNDNVVNQAPIGTGCLKITTNQGPIIAIFHQYALGGKGHTIIQPYKWKLLVWWLKTSPNGFQAHPIDKL